MSPEAIRARDRRRREAARRQTILGCVIGVIFATLGILLFT